MKILREQKTLGRLALTANASLLSRRAESALGPLRVPRAALPKQLAQLVHRDDEKRTPPMPSKAFTTPLPPVCITLLRLPHLTDRTRPMLTSRRPE
jgi:hypothetical protein